MKKDNLSRLVEKLLDSKEHFPWSGQLELTYKCSLNCVHCYCQVKGEKKRELSTAQWKGILDTLQAEGCMWLTLTGGDPVVRPDFLELYSYAKEKGFIITLFTNAHSLTRKVIDRLAQMPPHSIEVTLNGITGTTYESITRVKGSFDRTIRNIKLLAKSQPGLSLKSNCLKENKCEIARIKGWTEKLLGKPENGSYLFQYDPMIYPRLDGDKSPCDHRLSFDELVELRKQDPDIWKEFQRGLHGGFPEKKRDASYLYHCNPWLQQFYVDPYGRLKFCALSEKYSVDLKTTSFKEGFYRFPRLLFDKFKTASKCRHCSLRPMCYYCPARAFLETGDEEAPVPYYCRLAEETAKKITSKKKAGI